MVGECRGVSDAKVYRKDLFLAVQQQLKTAGEYEERRLRRRVDSTLNCSVCNKDTFQNSRIQLESFWRSRLCRYVPVSLCQLDAWNWMRGCGHSNHQLPAGHLAHAHFLVLCLRRSCSLLPSSCHSGIGTLKMSVPWLQDDSECCFIALFLFTCYVFPLRLV